MLTKRPVHLEIKIKMEKDKRYSVIAEKRETQVNLKQTVLGAWIYLVNLHISAPTWKINYPYMQHSAKYVNIQDNLLRLHATKLFRKSIWYWKINLIMTVSDITLARSNI